MKDFPKHFPKQIWDVDDLQKACGIQRISKNDPKLKQVCKELDIDYLGDKLNDRGKRRN